MGHCDGGNEPEIKDSKGLYAKGNAKTKKWFSSKDNRTEDGSGTKFFRNTGIGLHAGTNYVVSQVANHVPPADWKFRMILNLILYR
jgi:hypothetical protein